MKIPNEFREVMARNFYDKDMQIWTSKVAKDDEGSVISGGASEMIDSFKGNFQFKTREKIQEQEGLDELLATLSRFRWRYYRGWK